MHILIYLLRQRALYTEGFNEISSRSSIQVTMDHGSKRTAIVRRFAKLVSVENLFPLRIWIATAGLRGLSQPVKKMA
jgi:hypothetical protein